MSLTLPNEGPVEPDYSEKMLTARADGVVISQPPGAPTAGVGIVCTAPLFKYPILGMMMTRKDVNKVIRGLREGRDRLFPRE